MPEISIKGKTMPSSPIRKLVPYADAAKARGVHVYHLNIGQPDLETPEIMINTLKNYNEKVIAYTPSAGTLSYRQVLVEYYRRLGIDVTTDEIIVTYGASEAIRFAMQTCLNEGDEIIIPEPYYANYNGFASIAGVKVVPIVSSIEDNFALPPIEEFEKVITPKTKAIMICNPNNPTGYLYSKEELETLKKIVLKHDLFLFSDEVYREFCYDNEKHISVMHFKEIEQNVILFDSVSKRYSACGFRIGRLVSKNKDVIQTATKFAQARLSPPSFGQVAAEACQFLESDYFEHVIAEYDARRKVLYEELNKIEGVFCPYPKGAFYVVAKLPIDDSDKFAKWLLEEFQYNNETVMVAPASGFYSNPESGKDQVRISYCLKVDDLKKAIFCLDKALRDYPGRRI